VVGWTTYSRNGGIIPPANAVGWQLLHSPNPEPATRNSQPATRNPQPVTKATNWMHRQHMTVNLIIVAKSLGHIRFDDCRTDRIDADALGGELEGR
jgi:hypothetical protein